MATKLACVGHDCAWKGSRCRDVYEMDGSPSGSIVEIEFVLDVKDYP